MNNDDHGLPSSPIDLKRPIMEILNRRQFWRSKVLPVAPGLLVLLLINPSVRGPRAAQAGAAAGDIKSSFSAEEFLAPIKFLSGDSLKGRGNGTPELDQAAQYLADHYRSDG